jgi:hypothetical protein
MMDTSGWQQVAAVNLNFRRQIREPGKVIQLEENECRKAIWTFGRKLDRAFYGNAADRYGKRVRRIAVLEHSLMRGWHCHMAIEVPLDRMTVEQFIHSFPVHGLKFDGADEVWTLRPKRMLAGFHTC